jgi:cell division septum initiation protein DivIVA
MDEDISDLPVPTRENFSDLPTPNAQDISGLPVPQQTYAEEKPQKNIIDQGLEVFRQGLIGGIAGSVFPEFAQKTGQAIKTGGRAMGPYGRIPTAVGSAIEAGGVAMKASRPAAMATGVVGGLTGETAGQVYESQYGPGLGAELTRLTTSVLAPIPIQYLGTRAGGLISALATKANIPGFSTGRTVGQLLQEQGVNAPNLSGEQRAFILKKLDDIRGGQSSIAAEKEIVEMLKKDVARLRSTAATDANAIEAFAANQSKRILDDAAKRADEIRARARSYSPAIRQIAEIDAKDILTKAQAQVQQLEKQTRTQILNLRQQSGKLSQRSEQNIGKAQGEIKTIGQDKPLTDVFTPVQKTTLARQEAIIKERDVLDKTLRQEQAKIVAANENKGIKLSDMGSYKQLETLTRPFDPVTSPTVRRVTDPGVLAFYKRIRDSVIDQRYELTKKEAEVASSLGLPVQQDGERFYRVFRSSFEAADDARRFAGTVFKNPPEGYEAVKGQIQQNVYGLLKKLQEDYVGQVDRRALQDNWSQATRRLEQFETKAGKSLTEIEQGTADVLKPPAELANVFFGNRTGVDKLINLTGDERLVRQTAGDYVAGQIKGMNAQQVSSWLGQAKNKDFLSHPSLSDLGAKLQSYAANLARAERFGEARGKFATALRTKAEGLPEILTKQKIPTVMSEAEKQVAQVEQQRIKDAALGLKGQKKTASKIKAASREEAEAVTTQAGAEAAAVRKAAEDKAKTILAGTTDPARMRDIVFNKKDAEWEEMSRIVLAEPDGKKQFAKAIGQVIADKAGSSLKGAIDDWKYVSNRLTKYGLMDKAQTDVIASKLNEIYVAPASLADKMSFTQRLINNAILGYAIPRPAGEIYETVRGQ